MATVAANDDPFMGDEDELLAVITVSLTSIEAQGHLRGLKDAINECRKLAGYMEDRPEFKPTLKDVIDVLDQKHREAVEQAEQSSSFIDSVTLPTTQFMNLDDQSN